MGFLRFAWNSTARRRAGSLMVALGLAFAGTADASGAGRLTRLDSLMLIGFGVGFVSNLVERDTCRTLGERAIGGSAEAALGLTGAVAGTLLGGMLGSNFDGFAGTGIGAAVGGVAGREALGALGAQLGRSAAPGIEAGAREYNEHYEFRMCQMIQASQVLRQPLIERYLQVAEQGCGFDPDAAGALSNRDWDAMIACNNSGSREAREIVLQLIRLNQATCFAIERLGDAIVEQHARRVQAGGGSIMPFAPAIDPECDERSPGDVWGGFLNGRM